MTSPVTEYYIATVLDISHDRIHVVIYNELHMSARCAPSTGNNAGPCLPPVRSATDGVSLF